MKTRYKFCKTGNYPVCQRHTPHFNKVKDIFFTTPDKPDIAVNLGTKNKMSMGTRSMDSKGKCTLTCIDCFDSFASTKFDLMCVRAYAFISVSNFILSIEVIKNIFYVSVKKTRCFSVESNVMY